MVAETLLTLALGSVTGAFGATVFFAYLHRSLGDPEAQGRRPAVYIAVGAALFLGMAVYTLARPFL